MDFCYFLKKSLKIFQKNSPKNYVFRQNARKFNAGFWKFLKIEQNKTILCYLQKIFENFLKNFPHNLVFAKARKYNAGFFNFFEKSPKIIYFLQFSWENFWKFSKFSGVRGAPPPDPIRDRPPTMFPPPNWNPGRAAAVEDVCLCCYREQKIRLRQ